MQQLVLKYQIYESICDDHHSSVVCSLRMKFNKWCCCMGGNVRECRSPTSLRGRTRFPLLFNASLSFNKNYDGTTVLNQSANRAIILAKILYYAPRAGFSHF